MRRITTTMYSAFLSFIGSVVLAQTPSAGDRHGFYLCSNNIPVAWGPDRFGCLGVNDGYDHFTPIVVPELTDITKVEASRVHSVFLKDDGTVLTVGGNGNGQLGDGTTTDNDTVRVVSSLSGIIDISANNLGDFTLFLKNDGTVWGCGDNLTGQLGDGSSADKTIPVQTSTLTGITAISAGSSHSLFLKNDSTVWGCGQGVYGQIVNGGNNSNVPVQLAGLSGIIAIEAGYNYSVFLKSNGTVWACGENNNGQLGDSSTTVSYTPVQVVGLDSIIEIAAGENHTLFLKSDGTVWACGGDVSAHGNGTLFGQPIKVPVLDTLLSDIVHISAGTGFSIFVKNDGTVLTCGANSYGQLGTGSISGLPEAVPAARTMPVACDITTGITETNAETLLSLYPTPAKEHVTISPLTNGSIINILDVTGKVVYNLASTNEQIIRISTAVLVNGIYFVQIMNNGNIATKKLVVNK